MTRKDQIKILDDKIKANERQRYTENFCPARL